MKGLMCEGDATKLLLHNQCEGDDTKLLFCLSVLSVCPSVCQHVYDC